MKKLSSLSAYDGVFTGGGGGAPATYSSRIEDYKEIFRGSSSSIPILDLSALDGAADVAGARGSSKKLDYSKIFGGVRDDDVAESYEEVFAKRTSTKTASGSDGSAGPGSQKEGEYQRGTHKQYSTFYNRASQGSKDGGNGTTHVAQISAVPGFTCFVDENIQKGNNSGSLLKDKTRPIPQVSVDLNKKQNSVGTENIKRQSSWDKFVDANGSSGETNSFKLSSPNGVPASSVRYTMRSGELNFKVPDSGLFKTGPGDCSPTSSDEDVDVNSAAASSAAALRRAVREAEASIRLAKEIMERNKSGFQKFSKPRSKEGLEMKKKKVEKASVPLTRTENVAPNFQEIEEVGITNEGVRETNGANNNSHDDGQALITKLERKKARKASKVASSFEKSEEKSIVENIFGKGNEDKLDTSADSKASERFPELLKADKPKTTTLELENIGSNIMLFFQNVFGKGNEDKLEASADSKAPQQLPELLKTNEPKPETFEAEYTNGSNIRPFLQDVFGKGSEDKLEACADSKAPQQLPELLKTDDRKTETFEAEHTNGSNIRLFLQDVPKIVNEEKSETSADSEALGQFPEPVKTENQRNAVLEMGNTSGCNIMSVHNVSGKVNGEMVETSGDSEGLGQFPKLVKENLKTGHTNGNNIIPPVPNLSGKVKEDKLELSAGPKALGQLPELATVENQINANLELGDTNCTSTMPSLHNVFGRQNEDKLELMRAENQIDANLELGLTNGNSIMRSLYDLSGKADEGKLELSAESEQFPESVETDYQRTTTLELEQTNGSNIRSSIQNISAKVNDEKLEAFADFGKLGEFPELGKTDQRTAVLESEHRKGSNISIAIQNVHTKVNEDMLEQSADFKGPQPQEPPDLLKTENQGTASLDLRHNNGSNIMPPGHTSEGKEIKKLIDEGTLDVPEEGYSKETHRKRKQWKDFEGKASDIRIAEDTEQCVQNTTVQEVHGQEEKTLEPLEERKEIHRKRRQWKDVQVKPDDIKIAGVGEIYVCEQETKEKATDVQDKGKTSSSKESYEEESVKSQERVKNEDFVSSNVKSVHSEELDEAPKGVENEKIKECVKEPENDESLKGACEEKENVEHMCKQDEIEKKLQESGEWRDYKVAFEPESNMNGQNNDKDGEIMNNTETSDAWKEDGSDHSGDCQETQEDKADDTNTSFEGSEKMSDASQSSFDFKEDFDFDEEVGETSEIYQSCEFQYDTGRIRTCTESLIFNDTLENVDSNDEDTGERQTQLVGNHSQLVNNTSTGTKAAPQMHEENEDFDFKKQVDMECGAEASQPTNLFKSEEARGVYEQEWVTMGNMKEAAQAPNVLQGEEKTAEESWRKEVMADELSKREKEREKNRKVVERAIREARERAFAEARERAERAAVEKATAEARERVMTEARQKFEKTNTSTKPPTEKASLQAKLRSERAAVERANAEARERALEKALSQKANFPSSKMDGNNGESAERRNARLEKTQKTMERAAKALAEKNMRDLRAQREQAERHRLAETLDAEIKRWSSGKTGNLRSLLSTLQYILGPDSGWQPVSLTELVTASAVKKAYRKATLHVHPDKLQQRGASIQQKYICEKVFDLLKAAWNRFNSEER